MLALPTERTFAETSVRYKEYADMLSEKIVDSIVKGRNVTTGAINSSNARSHRRKGASDFKD